MRAGALSRFAVEPRSADVAKTALALSLLASAPAVFDLSREGAAAGLAAIVVLPLVVTWIRTQRLLIADPIIVIGLMWVIGASLPVLIAPVMPDLYRDFLWRRLSPWALDQAMLWMYRAWAGCSLAYWACRVILSSRRPKPMSQLNSRIEDRTRLLIGGLGLLASIGFIMITGGQSYSHLEGFSQTTTLDQIVSEVRQLSKIYVFLYFHARARGRLTANERYLLWATLGVYVLIFAASSSKIVAFELCAMWALGNAAGAARGKLLREFAVAAASLLLIYWVFYFITAYRQELVLRPPMPDAAISEVVSAQIDAAKAAVDAVLAGKELGSDENQFNAGSMLDRLTNVTPFASMLEHTAGYSPYENGYSSFMAPLLAIVPRELVGEKVQFLNSAGFAMLILGWTFGGFSVTIPGSLFWAWGFEGIVLGMAGFGLMLAATASAGERGGAGGLIWSAMTARLMCALLDVGAEFQGLMIGATRTLLVLLVLRYIARNLNFANRHAPPTWRPPHRRG